MKGRTTLILLAVLAAMAAAVYFLDVRGKAKHDLAAEKSKRVLAIAEDDIQQMIVARSDGDTIAVERNGNGWRITRPVAAAGDKYGVKNLVSEVAGAKAERTIDDVTQWAEYGLSQPRFAVFARSKSGAGDTLWIGDNNPTASFVYARKPGSFKVLVAGTTLTTSLGKSLFDLRDKTVLPFEKEDIRKIEIRRSGQTAVIEKAKDEWTLKAPGLGEVMAAKTAVDNILSKIKYAETKSFVNESPASLAAYGLSAPAISVVLSAGADPSQKKLLIGGKKGVEYFAKDENRPPVFMVDSALVSALSKNARDWREKRVATFDTWDVKRAEIRAPGKDPFVAVKDTSGDWSVQSPAKGKAKSWKLTGLFSELSGVEAREFVGKQAGNSAGYGFDKPAIEAVFTKENGDTLAFVKIGSAAGKDARYVKNMKTGWVYTVESGIIKKMTPNIDEIIEKPMPSSTVTNKTTKKS